MDKVTEIHGFKAAFHVMWRITSRLNRRGRNRTLWCHIFSVSATLLYAKLWLIRNFDVNAQFTSFTDGWITNPSSTPAMIADKIPESKIGKTLSPWLRFLVGLTDPKDTSQSVSKALEKFQKQAHLTQYVDAGDATPKSLQNSRSLSVRALPARASHSEQAQRLSRWRFLMILI